MLSLLILMMTDRCMFVWRMCWYVYVYLLLIVFVIWQCGFTSLSYAAYYGDLSVVQLLLSAHADVNQADSVSALKVSKLYYSLVQVLFILWFNHGDDDNDDDF